MPTPFSKELGIDLVVFSAASMEESSQLEGVRRERVYIK